MLIAVAPFAFSTHSSKCCRCRFSVPGIIIGAEITRSICPPASPCVSERWEHRLPLVQVVRTRRAPSTRRTPRREESSRWSLLGVLRVLAVQNSRLCRCLVQGDEVMLEGETDGLGAAGDAQLLIQGVRVELHRSLADKERIG